MNLSESFLGGPVQGAQAQVCLSDVQGLWGGREVYAWGTGRVVVRRVERGMRERRYEFSDPEGVNALFRLLMEVDFLTIAVDLRPGIPDEARPAVTVANSAGEKHSLSKWAGQKVERFDRVYHTLLGLEKQAESLPTGYDGPFVTHWSPTE